MSDLNTVLQSIVDSIGEQISDLGPSPLSRASFDAVITDVTNLQAMTAAEPTATKDLITATLTALQAVRTGMGNGTNSLQDLGPIVGNLDTLAVLLDANGAAKSLVTTISTRVNGLLSFRPDVQAILGDLEAIKALRGGPADTVAFHDFHVLQIAFKNVWIHAFDANLKTAAANLYDQTVKLYQDAGAALPDIGTVDDISALDEFITSVRDATTDVTPPIPDNVCTWFGASIVPVWGQLSDGQRAIATKNADYIQSLIENGQPFFTLEVKAIYDAMDTMAKTPEGVGGKIAALLDELGKAMSEPYSFDVFAPGTYNYGILLTYRQEWTPGPYQAGELRATVPLAPGESRKYSKKTHVKVSRAQREIEKSVSTTSLQTSDTHRAEASIMQKTDTATNFKMTAEGSYNIGVVDIKSATEFATSQASESASNKKDFRETTVKAAQEYRLERSLEVDTVSSTETEETSSGEISNPNNEITVTYLFYELQRRYKLNEYLYRVRPVILIAQEVPAPHEVDEAWLIEHQWILSRVLLDDSLRPSLVYLSSGYAGDEVSLEVIRAQWQNVRDLAAKLELQLNDQITVRNYYRDQVASLTYKEAQAKAVDDNVGWMGRLTEDFVGNFTGAAVDEMAAKEKYSEALLQNVNDNVADLQNKLKQATDALQGATAKYADALQKQFSRTVAIDQLRVHVKQNIIYYMQAIWSHEPPDQRFFRLYKTQVANPSPSQTCKVPATGKKGLAGRHVVKVDMTKCTPAIDDTTVDLVEIADVDTPLGFKGNYIIFPLKQRSYLTTYMMQEFISDTYGLQDPDIFATWKAMGSIDAVAQDVASQLAKLERGSTQWQTVVNQFADFVNETQGLVDEIIVPTGQLFIEALPGAHPLLEDFKLLHRAEDVRKVKAEVRHAELENLRLATRLVASQADAKNTSMLEDPDIEKKVVVEANADVKTGP